MPAHLGNQYAIGNQGGRPRIHKRDELAKKLVEWSKRPNTTHLNQFCDEFDLSPEYISRWEKEDNEFRQALQIVRARLGAKRENFLNENQFSAVAYKANLHLYDRFQYAQWKEEKEFESNLKKSENQFSEEDQHYIKSFLADLKKRNNIIKDDGLPEDS